MYRKLIAALVAMFFVVGLQAPAFAGTCEPYGCGGKIENVDDVYSIRVTYGWANPELYVKDVAPNTHAWCATFDGQKRCDVDGLRVPANWDIYCIGGGMFVHHVFGQTGWHKIYDFNDYRCHRVRNWD